MPDSSAAFPPATRDAADLDPQSSADVFNSPRSADSEPDVNAYAEAKVQSMETARPSADEGLAANLAEEEMGLLEADETNPAVRNFTPIEHPNTSLAAYRSFSPPHDQILKAQQQPSSKQIMTMIHQ